MKPERELEAAGLLIENIDEYHGSSLRTLLPPEPDVLATCGKRAIGIEVTDIHGIAKYRMTESEQERATDEVVRLWKGRGLPTIHLTVCWRFLPPGWRRSPGIAETICDSLQARLESGAERLDLIEKELDTALPPISPVDAVFAYRYESGDTVAMVGRSWSANVQASATLLQREINRKASRPSMYTATYSETVLLLVQRGGGPSSGFDVSASALGHLYASPFAKIFLLQLAPMKVTRLQVAPTRLRA